jgi:hypothetical protein
MMWLAGANMPSDIPSAFYDSYNMNLAYINDFLVAQHPYRKGHVCPFVQSSLSANGTAFSTINEANFSAAWPILLQKIDEFVQFKKQFPDARTSLILLLPEEMSEQTHLKLQAKAKKLCVQRHLMIGALYPTSDAPSLHSADYFPLRTPTPTLVLRDLVPMVMQFLTQDRHNVLEKAAFLQHYIEKFASSKSADTSAKVAVAKRYLKDIYKRMQVTAFMAFVIFAVGGYIALQ